MISNLHYISQGETPEEHLKNIRKMCAAGADWIQLRLKDESFETILETAKAAKNICDEFQVKLIINDFPEVANKVDAHGVHLGKEDNCPLEARKLLGPDKIIGGTANTLEDCEGLCEKQVDYIGLGPFRFTTTKKKLSPILGAEGYRNLIQSLRANGKSIPVIAIGGIEPTDLRILAEIGLNGVAISGWLTSHPHPEIIFKEIQQQFSEKQL
ncbi:thiamine phosphate synthase [Salegentibacter salegens]|uniref:Thiamine-phosphate synthase n=1 Tax=Salegentibacter salegens TaxID=143223 RepID=A0A1M7J0R6_9FLAO|nr:thiamine phosphate synthase [Salegentibacter salegens]PRX49882.1 thiamine-phosphate pyrophosphorylase [Salegentibacter salegens]SHM46545.1 thiamine-phosphate diphosphorylase [Salegentibacter salegens]